VYLALGDADQAREALEAARRLAPDDPKTLLTLGALNAKAGAYDRARQDYLRVLKGDQANVQALIGLAGVARGQGRHKQAIEWLQRASKAAPRAVRPRLLLATQYLDRREFHRARGVAVKAERIAPNRADVLAVLGVSQLLDKDYTNAIGSLKKAIGLAPRSVPLRYYLARAHLARREVHEARGILREVVEMAPGYSPAITTLAYLEAQAGKFDQALALVQGQQAQANPQRIEVEGDIRLMQGQYKQAAALYAKEVDGQNSARLAVKAYLARRKGGLPEPFRPLMDWVEGHPHDTRMRLILAQAYQEANQDLMAIVQYEALLKREPDNVRVLNNLAWIYHLQGDERSIQLAEKAHRLSPETGAVSDTLGWLLVGRGDLRRAVPLLRLAATQSPEVPEIQYHLAVALARSGEGRESQRILTRLISADERSPVQDQAQQLLKELNNKDLGVWQGIEWPYPLSYGSQAGPRDADDIDLRASWS
jgi:putative PEP-CTERM system TPR-repeat lipoprotein